LFEQFYYVFPIPAYQIGVGMCLNNLHAISDKLKAECRSIEREIL